MTNTKALTESLYFLKSSQLDQLKDCMINVHQSELSLRLVIEALGVEDDALMGVETDVDLDNHIATLEMITRSLESATQKTQTILDQISAQKSGDLPEHSTQSE